MSSPTLTSTTARSPEVGKTTDKTPSKFSRGKTIAVVLAVLLIGGSDLRGCVLEPLLAVHREGGRRKI